jgi:hypothetical protein
MNCSLNTVVALIVSSTALLAGAIAAAYFWPTAYPLLAAAAMVAVVSFGLIPAIKNALLAYAACRGPSRECSISTGINTLGQAASIISVVSFAVAGAMQIAALAFLFIWFLAWIGVGMQAAVAALVYSGIAACVAVIIILAGVLTQAFSFKNCMDRTSGGS